MEDADQAVGELAQRRMMADAAGAQCVVVSPGPRRCSQRTECLLVERVGFLKDGRTVEFSQSYYRGDTYDFVAELNAAT